MHARLVIDGRVLMASDAMPGQPYGGMKGFSLSLAYPTVADAKKVFDALSDGGNVTMPMRQDVLVRSLRHAGRPLRHAMDGQRPGDEEVRLFKTILIVVVVLVAGVLVLAATKPDTFRVARATSIEAPPEKIFPLDNMIGKDFEAGLANLKTVAEK